MRGIQRWKEMIKEALYYEVNGDKINVNFVLMGVISQKVRLEFVSLGRLKKIVRVILNFIL